MLSVGGRFPIPAGPKGRDMTDMLGRVVLVLVVATEADGDTEVDVDT